MATEMSENEQIKQYLDDHQYASAAAAVARAWSEQSEFGTRHCSLPGFEAVWVKFKTSGYPFSLRKRWDLARTDRAMLDLILPYVVAWNLTDVDGQPVDLPADGPRTSDLLDNIEDALLMWLIREFSTFWFNELLAPRKNF